ncbi:hypothetical protein BOTBODRAFT_146179 [Botryobasidium botryosum FD-172 SS1]|uniref:RNase III domain-containing protein n=1 Tax=Botryobasidium botryosum (strain FD-172 SS1) TaxID=930990 RepID=A0A067MPQ5_BOTB1|nr:hypothetical protein BOTBODRAFT_146179 [Botryobasidium botryosum FD-172 SS1]
MATHGASYAGGSSKKRKAPGTPANARRKPSKRAYDAWSLQDPLTGAFITASTAVAAIQKFTLSRGTRPEFHYDAQNGTCTIRELTLEGLPIGNPFVGASLNTDPSSAETLTYSLLCRELFDRGKLDHRCFPGAPRPEAGLPQGIPGFWKRVMSFPSVRAFPTKITVDAGPSCVLGASLIIAPRRPLPYAQTETFAMWIEGERCTIRMEALDYIDPSAEQQTVAYKYTVRSRQAMSEKKFSCTKGELGCFILPSSESGIDWEVAGDDTSMLPPLNLYYPLILAQINKSMLAAELNWTMLGGRFEGKENDIGDVLSGHGAEIFAMAGRKVINYCASIELYLKDPLRTVKDADLLRQAVVCNEPIAAATRSSGLLRFARTKDQPSHMELDCTLSAKRYPMKKPIKPSDEWTAIFAKKIVGVGFMSVGVVEDNVQPAIEAAVYIAQQIGIPIESPRRLETERSAHLQAVQEEPTAGADFARVLVNDSNVNITLLNRSYVHKTVAIHHSYSSALLQWVGDPIYEILVFLYALRRWGALRPGHFASIVSDLANNATLSAIASISGLYHYLQSNSTLYDNVSASAVAIREAQEQQEVLKVISEEQEGGGFWWELSAPKAGADIIETIIATFHISNPYQNWDLAFNAIAKKFLDENFALNGAYNSQKILKQIFKSWKCDDHTWNLATSDSPEIEEIDPDVAQRHRAEIVVHGISLAACSSSVSQSMAKAKAEFMAVGALESQPGFMLQHCNCKNIQESKEAMAKLRKELLGAKKTFTEWLKSIGQGPLATLAEGLTWEHVKAWDEADLVTMHIQSYRTRMKILGKIASMNKLPSNSL